MKLTAPSANLPWILALTLFAGAMYLVGDTQSHKGFMAGVEYILAGLAAQYLLVIFCARRIIARQQGGSGAERAWRIAAHGVIAWLVGGLVALFLAPPYAFIEFFFLSIFALQSLAGFLLFLPLPMNSEAQSLRLATGAILFAFGGGCLRCLT